MKVYVLEVSYGSPYDGGHDVIGAYATLELAKAEEDRRRALDQEWIATRNRLYGRRARNEITLAEYQAEYAVASYKLDAKERYTDSDYAVREFEVVERLG